MSREDVVFAQMLSPPAQPNMLLAYLTPYSAPTLPNSRYDTRKDIVFAKDAPVIGLVLQRSHLVTGDHGHYDGVVSELESRGAKVVPVFAGEHEPQPRTAAS